MVICPFWGDGQAEPGSSSEWVTRHSQSRLCLCPPGKKLHCGFKCSVTRTVSTPHTPPASTAHPQEGPAGGGQGHPHPQGPRRAAWAVPLPGLSTAGGSRKCASARAGPADGEAGTGPPSPEPLLPKRCQVLAAAGQGGRAPHPALSSGGPLFLGPVCPLPTLPGSMASVPRPGAPQPSGHRGLPRRPRAGHAWGGPDGWPGADEFSPPTPSRKWLTLAPGASLTAVGAGVQCGWQCPPAAPHVGPRGRFSQLQQWLSGSWLWPPHREPTSGDPARSRWL